MRRFLITCFAALPVLLSAQAPTTPQTERPSAEPSAAAGLPVRRVVLYKAGVGYFEHLGTVRDRQDVTVRFTSAQLNDVLNSLTVLDLGRGQVTGISYNSAAPLEQRLGALRLPLGESTTQTQMLDSLRGARVGILGVAFKPNVRDARNSPAAAVSNFGGVLMRSRSAVSSESLIATDIASPGSKMIPSRLLSAGSEPAATATRLLRVSGMNTLVTFGR